MILIFVLVLTICVAYVKFKKPKYNLPPGPTGFPFLGYLPSYLGTQPYELLKNWSKEYGDIYRIRIAGKMYFVLNNYDLIREAYVHNGIGNNFNSRPQDYNVLASALDFKAMGVINGPAWTLQRKLFSSVMRRSDRTVEDAIYQSAATIVTQIHDLDHDRPMDVYNLLAEGVLSVLSTLVCGQRLVETDPEIAAQIISDARLTFANAPGGDGFLAGWIVKILMNPFTKKYSTVKEIKARQFKIMSKFLEEHEQDFESLNLRDYIDTCLNERSKSTSNIEKEWLSNSNLVANMFLFFLAGTDSTAATLYFAIFLLAKHPEIQEKCIQEIKSVLGEDANGVKGSDRARLPYLSAVINEINRYSVIGPLPSPRENVLKTTLGGYDIPAGSHFVTNLWAATRDPKYFSIPNEFDPNNFYGKQLPRDLATLSFSAGKRACPADNFATLEIFLVVAHLLQNFKISPAPDEQLEESVIPGFVRCLSPFKVIFTEH